MALIILFSINACEDDNNVPLNEQTSEGESGNPFLENFGDSITARFIGTVVNEENNPISGVTVTVGNSMAVTDQNGVFSVESATVYEKFAYVKASKSGFIDGSRALVPTDGVNQVKIMLLELEVLTTVSSGQTISVGLPNGTAIDFAGDYQYENGNAYQGNVDVVLKHINPDDEDMELQMPGMLLAENLDGDLRVLETYGMIAVELIGENGEELNIAEGTVAEISIPVPTSATNPPATIPLWHFDEVNGYWVEEGEATLIGNMYVGEVTHFSFWNCDAPFETVDFCVTIVDENNDVIPNLLVLITTDIATWSQTASGWTNSNGEVCGLIPNNETLVLTVPDFGCINNDYTENIGPFTTDQNITVTVTDSNPLNTNLTATLNDCTGNPITNGYANVFYNNQSHIIAITNGMLSENIAYCSADTSYSIQIFDLGNSQTTDTITGNFTTPTTDLGTQMSCVDLADSDGDGVLDMFEDLNGNDNLDDDDTDGDGTADYLDEDDDGDGVNTADEDYDNDGNPMNEDSDGDQIPDYLDALDVSVFASEIFANTNSCDSNALEYDLTQWYTDPVNTYEYFETATDTIADTNPITNPAQFIATSSIQVAFVKGNNTISNQSDYEAIYLLGIQYIDSDNDGLSDCEEMTGVDNNSPNYPCNPNGNITDPFNADSDNDGYDDCYEASAGTNPNDALSIPIDSDGDGVIDFYESNPTNGNITDPFDPCDYNVVDVTVSNTSGNDCDGDGVNDADEIGLGTDPLDPCDYIVANITNTQTSNIDCDGDGVLDAIEIVLQTNPLDPCDYNVLGVTEPITSDADCDSDGLTNQEEVNAEVNGVATGFSATDPLNPDSDGDGVNDGNEVNNNTDPNDATDF